MEAMQLTLRGRLQALWRLACVYAGICFHPCQ